MEGKQATGECNKKELKRHPVNTVRMNFHHRDKAFLTFSICSCVSRVNINREFASCWAPEFVHLFADSRHCGSRSLASAGNERLQLL